MNVGYNKKIKLFQGSEFEKIKWETKSTVTIRHKTRLNVGQDLGRINLIQ